MPASTEFTNVPAPSQLRKDLRDLVLNDLRGPAGGEYEEVAESRVGERYLVGSLAPKGARLAIEDDDDLTTAGDDDEEPDGAATPDAKSAIWMLPTSFGLSFMVDAAAAELAVIAKWGRYTREDSETALTKEGNPKRVWKRQPMGGEPVIIPLREFPDGDNTHLATPDLTQPGITISGRIRKRDHHWHVTLFLNNEQEEGQLLKDRQWIFQAEMTIEGVNGKPIFIHRPVADGRPHLEDEREAAMLYRKQLEFASGHGTAVHVTRAAGDRTRAIRLQTVSAPEYEVPFTDQPKEADAPLLGQLVVDMQRLSDLKCGSFREALTPLTRAYAAWIATRRTHLNDPDLADHQEAALRALEQCDAALARIQAGIELLDSSEQAAEAFRFANRAMHQQRIHTRWVLEKRSDDAVTLESVDIEKNRSWRPFQLAFILANLPSLTDLHHPDRSIDPSAHADLLWFPTGGGKTEAYLGLTAFTLAIRRLQGTVAGHDCGHGVAVIMRYTLRLLTLQQFQRATALIMACEVIRREEPAKWGNEPFRIGLWVGMSMTPNRTNQAEKAISSSKGSGFGSRRGNPHQLTNCPWCGTPIDPRANIDVDPFDKGEGRTFIYCGDKLGNCPFSRKQAKRAGLPVLVVDEEIYRHPPSLLIATVDKFAQMPWKGEVQSLFGRVSKFCERHGFLSGGCDDTSTHRKTATLPAARTISVPPLRPPDLIIQDELHLISGPLGTMVGLYETAVDGLCTWMVNGQQVRPKVVASTATIARAPEQVKQLFMRDVNVFPPSGLDAHDNFFSIQRKPSDEPPGRLYLGVCARGTRLKAAMIRVYLAILSASQKLANDYGDAADPYMTLVGYFGALRELGGMRRLVDDDVTQRLGSMEARGLARRGKPVVEELTSRLSSEQVPAVLDRLGIRISQRDRSRGLYPIDVLLATNMISVGVDVPRLGVMAISGQP